MHTNSRLLFEKYARPLFLPGTKVLEIGPDKRSTYCTVVNDPNVVWHTLDLYDSPKLTYPKASLYSFPIPDGTYDIVLSGQVLEHVAKIWRWMPELARVTRPGGLVVTVAPTSWPFHEAPIDCWRVFPDALRALSDDAGLVVELAICESLELPQYKNALFGRSPEQQTKGERRLNRLLGRFGFRVEKSLDTICIARKPG